MTGDYHVLPLGDLIEHDAHRACWCRPCVEADGGRTVVIHHAADAREAWEQEEMETGQLTAHLVEKRAS